MTDPALLPIRREIKSSIDNPSRELTDAILKAARTPKNYQNLLSAIITFENEGSPHSLRPEIEKITARAEPRVLAKAYRQRGKTFFKAGHLTEAQERFQQAVRISQNISNTGLLISSKFMLAVALFKGGQYGAAKKNIDKLFPLTSSLPAPRRAEVFFLAAKNYYFSGHQKRAEKSIFKAGELAPNNIDIKNFSAVVSYRAGDKEKASELFKQVLSLDANNPFALSQLGLINYLDGDNKAALKFITQAFTANTKNFTAGVVASLATLKDGAQGKAMQSAVFTFAEYPLSPMPLLLGRIKQSFPRLPVEQNVKNYFSVSDKALPASFSHFLAEGGSFSTEKKFVAEFFGQLINFAAENHMPICLSKGDISSIKLR